MDIALLNKRLIVQKKESIRSDSGVSTSSWQPDFMCWCTVSNESGSTDSGEGMEKTSVDISFTVRWSRQTLGVHAMSHRILFEGEYFDIVSVDHNSYKGSMVKYNCRKVRSSNVR